MGCGSSKPAAPAAAKPAVQQPPQAKQSPLNGKLVETATSAEETSRETTPNQAADGEGVQPSGLSGGPGSAHGSAGSGRSGSLPSSQKTSSRRSMDAKLLSNSLLMQKAQLPGPGRDYKGLPLQRREDPKLAHITALASAILKAPVALVVLGYGDQMLLVSAHGIEAQDDAWLPDVCAWALSNAGGVLTIEDMETDLRTHKLPWVMEEEPNVNFFTGTPVHTLAGEWLGVLCVLDFEPRLGATPLCMSLPNLAEMVARELPAAAPTGQADDSLFRAMDSYWDGSVLVNVREGRWRIRYSNQAFSSMTGVNHQLLPGKELWDVVEPLSSDEKPWEAHADQLARMEQFDIYPVVVASAWRPASQRGSANTQQGSDQASDRGSDRARKFKITMRPNTPEIMAAYEGSGPVEGWYFAVFTNLATASRESAGALAAATVAAAGGSAVPFEDVEVGPVLGRGSFGCVFRAVWSARIVAIKVIEFRDIGRLDSATGSPLEVSLMINLKHPNVLETIKYATQHKLEEQGEPPPSPGGADGTPPPGRNNMTLQYWLMLEYCDLGPLSDAIRGNLFHKDIVASNKGTLRVPLMRRILQCGLDIARGIAFIHQNAILHGDLTAGNVLLASAPVASDGRDFVAKIADFGLSRQAISSKVETNTYGTVTHMPPELLNDGLLSKAADVYAFGVLLYEMLTQRQVWEGLRHPQIIHAIAVQKRHPEFPPTTPAPYKALADRCMASEPEDRPDMEAVIQELQTMLESKHIK